MCRDNYSVHNLTSMERGFILLFHAIRVRTTCSRIMLVIVSILLGSLLGSLRASYHELQHGAHGPLLLATTERPLRLLSSFRDGRYYPPRVTFEGDDIAEF